MCACVAFSPDGMRLASAGADRTIRIWDATPLSGDEGQEMWTFTEHDDEVRALAYSPDGQWIASAGHGADVKVWDPATRQVPTTLNGATLIVFGLAWQHPDGKRIAAAGGDGRRQTVKVWDVPAHALAYELPAGQEYLAVTFSPDGRYLLTGRLSGDIEIWDADTGKRVGTLGSHAREIRAVVFSRDGKQVATASPDGTVKLWDWDPAHLNVQREPRLPPLHARIPRPSLNVAFSPDGLWLATGGERNTVKIWDTRTGKPRPPLWGHSGEVYTLAFSPDGKWVASAGEDSTVKVWDWAAGKLVRSFRGHTGLVSRLAFSPDGKRLVTGSRDKTIKMWDLTSLSGQEP
jgi:WD40 repeat protein